MGKSKKGTRRLVDLDALASVPRVKVPWPFAVDLGFARMSFSVTNDLSDYDVPNSQGIVNLYTGGVIVTGSALAQAITTAPRAVRHRIRGLNI